MKQSNRTPDRISGWHVATASELSTLEGVPGSALFLAFAGARESVGATNVIGAYKATDGSVATVTYIKSADLLTRT